VARPRFHLLVTAPVAVAAYRRWGRSGALGAAAGGLFVDFDHLLDYLWVRMSRERSHYFAPLHAWELALAAGAFAWWTHGRRNPFEHLPDRVSRPKRGVARVLGAHWPEELAAGLAAGLFAHLVQDVITNRPGHPGVYALSYRLRHGFRREATGWGEHTRFHHWSKLPWYRWF
jgi:hypothetical protein